MRLQILMELRANTRRALAQRALIFVVGFYAGLVTGYGAVREQVTARQSKANFITSIN
jgi:hypothetical protein